jgi:peptidoglycan-associated lipoprotein
MKHTIFSSLATLSVAALLTACGSSVKLDEVPVENRTGSVVTPQPMPMPIPMPMPTTSDVLSKAVAPVEIAATSIAAVGPMGVTKVIYFDYDSFTIKSEFQGAVEAHAKYMAVNKTIKLSVEGHTDERGGREYNLALGQKRAEAVRRALGLLGVTDAQVEAVSFGKEKPANSGMDEAALAKNRRAELSYR